MNLINSEFKVCRNEMISLCRILYNLQFQPMFTTNTKFHNLAKVGVTDIQTLKGKWNIFSPIGI